MSCGAGVNSSSEELSADAYYRASGHNFSYIRSHSNLHRSVFPTVTGYCYDADFILVKQDPNYEHHKTMLASELNHGTQKFEHLLLKADSILKQDPFFTKTFSGKINFWIIVNKTTEIVGPLSESEFRHRCNELGVSRNLQRELM
jgi:hypothetical protein